MIEGVVNAHLEATIALSVKGPELGSTHRLRRGEDVTMTIRSQSACDETARRGDEIYEQDIKPALGENQHGRCVAIDVDSGESAIADEVLVAADELRARCPDAPDVWLLRVGYRELYGFGGQGSRTPDSLSARH